MTTTESRPSSGKAPEARNKAGWLARSKEYMDSRAGLDYLMLRIIIFLLIGIGVTMVFSSSMATSYVESTGVWNEAVRQTLMVFAGLFFFGLRCAYALPLCASWCRGSWPYQLSC